LAVFLEKRKVEKEARKRTTFSNTALLKAAKIELIDIIQFVNNYDIYYNISIKI